MDADVRVELVRSAYEAWNAQDVDAGLALMSDDVEWHGPPDSPFAGPHRGRAQVRRFFRSMVETFEELHRSPSRVEVHGEHVLAEVTSRVRGRGSGAAVEVRLFDVFTIPDDLATSYAVFATRAEALDWIQAREGRLEPEGAGR